MPPRAALLVVSLGTMAVWASGLPETAIAAVIVIFSAVVHLPDRTGVQAGLVAALALTCFTAVRTLVDNLPAFYIGLVGLTCLTAVVTGAHNAARQRYVEEVEQRANEVEAHRLTSEREIVQQERNRIARELHDVVANGLSLIVVQAGAAQRVIDRDTEGAREALNVVERTAPQSLEEMRHALGALRSDTENDRRPTPSLATLEELVADFRASGLVVELDLDNRVSAGNNTLEAAAYRIVQESLTNVLKHGGDNAKVWVELFGGKLRSGGRQGGGFEVQATLPLESARV
ncbi:MAG: signal transduction histidine kinase [Acidimicrobiales bacterium]|jgi:signal transduction histidine kinase